MNNFIHITQVGALSVASGIFGSELCKFVGQVAQLSEWEQKMLGPFGLILFGGSVLAWLVSQLAKERANNDKRTEQHEQTIATLVELGITSKNAIEKNTEVIESVKEAMRKCSGSKV